MSQLFFGPCSQVAADGTMAALNGDIPADAREEHIADVALADVWWVTALKDHTCKLGLVVPPTPAPVTMISGCTGCFAEAFVFKDWVLRLEQ